MADALPHREPQATRYERCSLEAYDFRIVAILVKTPFLLQNTFTEIFVLAGIMAAIR